MNINELLPIKDKDKYIGTHICIDLISNSAELLKDISVTEKYLTDIVDLADMTMLIPPKVFNFPYASEYTRLLEKLEKEGTKSPIIDEALNTLNYNKENGSGNTGFVVLSESHSAIHTWSEKETPFLSMCLYSCKPYDVDKIINFTKNHFDAKSMEIMLFHRYMGIPQNSIQISL